MATRMDADALLCFMPALSIIFVYNFVMRQYRRRKMSFVFIALVLMAAGLGGARHYIRQRPVVDSAMTWDEAMRYVSDACPENLKQKQCLVDVRYWGFEGRLHRGQILLDCRLRDDILKVFQVAYDHRFPIQSVMPLAHERFVDQGQWCDDLSMAQNNTSAFHYRQVTGGSGLSRHALGLAVDINPKNNPYIKGQHVLPEGAVYHQDTPGTLDEDHPVTQMFKDLGWTWGGDWVSLKDYQHFEKVLK